MMRSVKRAAWLYFLPIVAIWRGPEWFKRAFLEALEIEARKSPAALGE